MATRFLSILFMTAVAATSTNNATFGSVSCVEQYGDRNPHEELYRLSLRANFSNRKGTRRAVNLCLHVKARNLDEARQKAVKTLQHQARSVGLKLEGLVETGSDVVDDETVDIVGEILDLLHVLEGLFR